MPRPTPGETGLLTAPLLGSPQPAAPAAVLAAPAASVDSGVDEGVKVDSKRTLGTFSGQHRPSTNAVAVGISIGNR